MKPHQIRNSLLLFLTAIIWGTSFVAQSVAMDYIKPFTFNGIRFTIGGIILLPFIALLERKKKKEAVKAVFCGLKRRPQRRFLPSKRR